MKRTIIALLGFVLVANCAFSQAKKKVKGRLDRKGYTCTFLEAGAKDAFADELKFNTGTLVDGLMLDAKYKATLYDATVDSSGSAPTVSFTCDAKNTKEEEYYWEGTVTGDNIEGKLSIIKKGKISKSYTFNGTLKGAKKKTDY